MSDQILDEIQARADAWEKAERDYTNYRVDGIDLNIARKHSVADVPRLVAALRAVEAMHVREVISVHECGEEAWCPACKAHWPCPTIAAVHEALEGK